MCPIHKPFITQTCSFIFKWRRRLSYICKIIVKTLHRWNMKYQFLVISCQDFDLSYVSLIWFVLNCIFPLFYKIFPNVRCSEVHEKWVESLNFQKSNFHFCFRISLCRIICVSSHSQEKKGEIFFMSQEKRENFGDKWLE